MLAKTGRTLRSASLEDNQKDQNGLGQSSMKLPFRAAEGLAAHSKHFLLGPLP